MRPKFLLLAAALTLSAAWSLVSCQDSPKAAEGPALTASGSATQAAPATIEERFLNEPNRRALRLTNGFTIILEQNKTAPVVAARVYVKAGALTEQQFMAKGISHVVEHLVAGATSGKRKEDENTLLLQQIGNDSDAYTDADHTCYFITTTADKWPVALDLLVDWTTDANFTREEFAREFKVVQREIEMDEAEADRIVYQHTLVDRYIVNPSRHPIVGYKSAFQTITYEDCKAYYEKMYVPDNMIVSVAGDIDLDKAEAMIINQLKNVRRKSVPAIALPAEPPVAIARRSVSNADIHEARVEWAFPTMTMYNPDLYATDVLASVLGGSESSMLVRKLRDELGVAVNIEASHPTPSYVEGQVEIDAVLAPDKLPAAQQALLSMLGDVVKNGVPADAVERAKAQAAAQLVYGNQTAEQQAIRNALDFMATDNIDYTANYVKRIQAVTPEQVQAVARKYLAPERMLTTIVLPNGAKDPFAGETGAQQAAAGAVTVQKTVLKNGVTLLISRNPSAPLAVFNLYTLGGLLAENDQTNGTGNAMMELMTRGTESRTHEQIADFLDATGTTLTAESGSNSFNLSMTCLKDKAADAFGLFTDVALHPKFDKGELDQLRPQLLAAVDESTEDWFGEAYKAIKNVYYTSSPYKRLPVGKEDVVNKLTPEQIRSHYQDYFLDPQKMVIAISGDIDPAAAARWAAAFESIPARSPSLELTSTAAPAGTHPEHTNKQSATVMIAYPPGMTITSPDRYAVTLLQTYIGGYNSEGGSLLFTALRGRGLVYTVQASNISGPAGGMFLVAALGEPQNAQAITSGIQELVDGVKKGNIPDSLFDAAKDQAITGEKLSKQTIADISASQALNEALGLGYNDDAQFADRIRAVTKAQVIAAANKYLNAPVIVIMTPDAKK